MKKPGLIGQFMDVIYKIIIAFIIVFGLYFISKFVNSFAYEYFIFPFISVVVIFVCGINVGRALEKIKHNESTGIFTKQKKENDDGKGTEFIIDDTKEIITNKKILKELEEGEIVHVKTNQMHEPEDVIILGTREQEIVKERDE